MIDLDDTFLGTGFLPPDDEEFVDEDLLLLTLGDICRFTDDQALYGLAAIRRLRSRLDGLQARVLDRFARIRGDVRGVDDEVAYELRITRHTAARRLDESQALVRRHPYLLDAMDRGEVDGYAASRVLDITATLSDELARQVDSRMSDRCVQRNPTDLRRVVRAVVLEVDPDGQTARARRARNQRKVELLPGEDSMSTLIAELPAEVASAAYDSINQEAQRLRNAGESRTLEQLRADILGERPIGGANGEKGGKGGAQVMLHMPIGTALAISDDGCELDGYGPIAGPIARQIMSDPNSVWRKVICDPATGAVQDLGRRRYRPTQAIRDIVNARDRECATPGCHRAAIASEYDHVQSRANGGDTSTANGSPSCKHHNLLKEQPGWRMEIGDRTYTIITPTGRKYTRDKPTVHKPKPPPQPKPRPPLPEHPPF